MDFTERYAQLQLKGIPWLQDGHWFATWTAPTKASLAQAGRRLQSELHPYLSPCCTHSRGHGGVKGTVRWLMRQINQFYFVARFDVDSYYQSMRHNVMLELLRQLGTDLSLQSIVRQYLEVPDINHSGIGMVAGGSLSPLLGALYLLPLDRVIAAYRRG